MKFLLAIYLLIFSLSATDINSLDALLNEVEAQNSLKLQKAKAREAEFLQSEVKTKKALVTVKQQLKSAKQETKQLKKRFEKLSAIITKKEKKLEAQKGELRDVFSTIRMESRDLASALQISMVSSQEPQRETILAHLSSSKKVPNIDEIKSFWRIYFTELVKSGEVVSYETDVIHIDGSIRRQKVTRLGLFSAYSDNAYLRFDAQQGKMSELLRQPSSDKVAMIATFDSSHAVQPIVIDPSRGVLFSMLKERATIKERIAMGGVIGYIILTLGGIIILFALFKLVSLLLTELKINREMKSTSHSDTNPLGRILRSFERSKNGDIESVEAHIDAAILAELPRIQNGLPIIKLVAAVAPLLGLLGTVTGMIETFQAITLFGSGDAKLMASGISQALMTTVLGLVVAIPTLFIHSLLHARARRIVAILTQQSSAIIADEIQKRASNG